MKGSFVYLLELTQNPSFIDFYIKYVIILVSLFIFNLRVSND